jgi:ATP-dependent protease HslVU (ClpYQ) ATPase subunit
MNKILQLRPTEFTWIEQEKQDVGFIAQEVEEIIPEVIETTDGFVDSETGEKSHENTKTISYTKLIPYLVDTIQQMDKRIKELEERDN